MKPFAVRIFFAALLILTVASCRAVTIYNVENYSLNASPNATMEDVESAIKRAGAGLGWHIKSVSPGILEARLTIRRHLAVTAIRYDTKVFSINYRESTNLKYNMTDKTIHSNYVGWVQNLQKAILAEASKI